MIELKDFITVMQKNTDNYILQETTKGVLRYSIGIAVDVNEEKCKKWIKQAMEIENFTEEQIEDLKIRHLFDKKDAEIKYLEDQNWKLRQEIQELKERNGEW